MIEKKVFVLDSKIGNLMSRGLCGIVEKEKLNVKIKTSIVPGAELPSDQDLYILHLSDIKEEDVLQLKKQQPYSTFIAITRMGLTDNPEELKSTFDDMYQMVEFRDQCKILNDLYGNESNKIKW